MVGHTEEQTLGDTHEGTHGIIHTEEHTWRVKHTNAISVVPTSLFLNSAGTGQALCHKRIIHILEVALKEHVSS